MRRLSLRKMICPVSDMNLIFWTDHLFGSIPNLKTEKKTLKQKKDCQTYSDDWGRLKENFDMRDLKIRKHKLNWIDHNEELRMF